MYEGGTVHILLLLHKPSLRNYVNNHNALVSSEVDMHYNTTCLLTTTLFFVKSKNHVTLICVYPFAHIFGPPQMFRVAFSHGIFPTFANIRNRFI